MKNYIILKKFMEIIKLPTVLNLWVKVILYFGIINRTIYVIFLGYLMLIGILATIKIILLLYYNEYILFLEGKNQFHILISYMDQDQSIEFDEATSINRQSYYVPIDTFNTFIEKVNCNKIEKKEDGFFLPCYVVDNFIQNLSKIDNPYFMKAHPPIGGISIPTNILEQTSVSDSLSCTCISKFSLINETEVIPINDTIFQNENDSALLSNKRSRIIDLESTRSVRPRIEISSTLSSINNNIIYLYDSEIKTYINPITNDDVIIYINLPYLNINNSTINFSEILLENYILNDLGEKFSIAKHFKPILSSSIINLQDFYLLNFNKFLDKYPDISYQPFYRVYINYIDNPYTFNPIILCSDIDQILKIFNIDPSYNDYINDHAINRRDIDFSNAISIKIFSKSSKIIIYLEDNKYIIEAVYKYLSNRDIL
jgi:hypothetical protein